MAKLLKDRTARTLSKVSLERELQARYNNFAGVNAPFSTNLKTYIIVLPNPLDAATNNGDGTWLLSSTPNAKVYTRPDPSNKYSPYPTNSIISSSFNLSPAYELDGATQITRRVFNFTATSISANTPYLAVQDTYGDLYIINATGGSTPALTGIYYVAGPNNDNASVPMYGVLWNSGDGEVVILGINYLSASRPYTQFDIHWYVNRDSVIPVGEIGICDTLIEKPGPVRIDPSLIGTITLGTRLGPKKDSYTIWPGYPGFTAIGPDYLLGDDDIPVVDCVQHPVLRVFGRLYTDLTQNAAGDATAEFEIWRRDTDGKRKPAGWEHITVYGTLMNKDEVAKKGTFGFADYSSDYWEGDFACDQDNTDTSETSQASLGSSNLLLVTAPSDPPTSPIELDIGTGTGTGT